MGFCKGAVGFLWCVGEGLCPSRGRPQGSPLRKHYKKCGGAGRCGEQPLRKGLCPRLKTKSPPTAVKDDALHRDTTLLRRPLTQNGLTECRYTPALSRAPPFEPEAAPRPSTRRLRSHVPPSVPRPLSPARALFGGLKWGTLSFTAFSFLFLGLFYPAVLCLSMFLLGFVPDCGIVLDTNDQGGYPE